MHAKPDLRVFFEAMISGSGSVIVAVIQLHGRISHMRQWKLRFSVRSLLIATAIFGITIAWVVSSRNVRVAQSNTADFLHENAVYLSERGLNFKRQNFFVGDRFEDLVGNSLPIRDPSAARNHWTEIGSRGYEHAYVTNKTKLSFEQLSTSLEKLPWLKSATIHEELYNDAEVERLGERFPNIVFHSSILIAE